MAEEAAGLESRPVEPKRNEGTDRARLREIDRQLQHEESTPKQRARREVDKVPAPLPRWPFILVGLIVAVFVASVLYIIFWPRADVPTADAYVMVHYATIAPRISGQVAAVPVDDNETVKAGQVLTTLDPSDNETAL